MVDMVDAGQSGGKQVETFHEKSDEQKTACLSILYILTTTTSYLVNLRCKVNKSVKP